MVGILFSLIYYSTVQVSNKTFSYNPTAGPYTSLTISDVDGLVSVIPWSQSSILINGTLTAKGLGSSLSTITLFNSTDNGDVIFKASFPVSSGILFSQIYKASINVYVPSAIRFDSIQISNVNGGVKVDGANSTKVAVTTVNGNVTIGCAYCVNEVATSTNGNVTAVFNSLASQGLYNLTATNANVSFTAPSASSFKLTATVVNGLIVCAICKPIGQGQSLTEMFGSGSASVNLYSVNGQISIAGA